MYCICTITSKNFKHFLFFTLSIEDGAVTIYVEIAHIYLLGSLQNFLKIMKHCFSLLEHTISNYKFIACLSFEKILR